MVKGSWIGAAVGAAFAASAAATSAPLPMGAVETPDAIRAAITDALKPRLNAVGDATFDIGALDARLRLPPCDALAVELPTATGPSMTAKVGCPSPNWTIYVPVRVHAWTEAIVAATNLAPNTRLTAAELSRGRVDMFGAAGGLITDANIAEGKILRTGVVAGSPILQTLLDQPLVVHRGERLILTLTDGTMEVTDSVVALEDGRIGDTIALKNTESDKTVHATVTDNGAAEIKF